MSTSDDDSIGQLFYGRGIERVYPTYPLRAQYIDWEEYFSESELPDYEHYFRIEMTSTGRPYYVDFPFEKIYVDEFSDVGDWIMDTHGNLYMMPRGQDAVNRMNMFFIEHDLSDMDFLMEYDHHDTILQGNPIACGGEYRLNDGRLVRLNNQSGHYRPPAECLANVLLELERRGVRSRIEFIPYIPGQELEPI